MKFRNPPTLTVIYLNVRSLQFSAVLCQTEQYNKASPYPVAMLATNKMIMEAIFGPLTVFGPRDAPTFVCLLVISNLE